MVSGHELDRRDVKRFGSEPTRRIHANFSRQSISKRSVAMLNDRRDSGRRMGSQVADLTMRARELLWFSYIGIALLILVSGLAK
jgi:hypothetical protein